jgi:hypothetical protein
MADIIILGVTFVCMAVSMLISFWGGRRFTRFRAKLAFFLIASIVGMALYPILGGLSAGFAGGQLSAYYHAMRDDGWIAYLGVVAISLFGAWVLPKMMAGRSN